jgi:hypothetical protein
VVRDKGLETLVEEELEAVSGLTQKGMFGGWMWLLHGNLLCGAREEGLLVRLGKDRDGWALAIDGIEPMFSGARRMHGWVRAAPHVYADAALRRLLIDGALGFVRSLPRK